MAGVVQGFRWAMLGVGAAADADVVVDLAWGWPCLLLVSGVAYFRRMERTFADII